MTHSPFLNCHVWFSIVTNFASSNKRSFTSRPQIRQLWQCLGIWTVIHIVFVVVVNKSFGWHCFVVMLFKASSFINSPHFISYNSQSSCPLGVLLLAIIVLFVLHVWKPLRDFLCTCHSAQLAVYYTQHHTILNVNIYNWLMIQDLAGAVLPPSQPARTDNEFSSNNKGSVFSMRFPAITWSSQQTKTFPATTRRFL